jgi:HAMP domain-containing protein
MTLRVRFSLIISALTLAVVAGTSGILYLSQKSSLLQEARRQEEKTLRSLAQVARESFLSQDDLMLINYAGSLPAGNPELEFAYLEQDGKILAHSKKALSGVSVSALAAPEAGIETLRAPVVVNGRAEASAVLGFSTARIRASVDAALSRTRKRILGVAGLMVVAGLAASLALAASLSRPISELARAATALGTGRLDTRIDASRSDELGLLAGEFNAMAGKLQRLDEMKKDFVSAVTHEL